jgi:hypothetical protein
MKEISLYFAGAWAGTCSSKEAGLGVTNKLCSFLYPDQLNSWLNVSLDTPGKILIDSGAFSAWNKGKEVDFDTYIQYCKTALADPRAKNKTIRVVNLDVIPGKKGETSNLTKSIKKEDKAIIEDAARAGYNNLLYFIENGITPIHVFHQGEDFKWLEKMVERTDYIGISPANDVGMDQKRLWIDRTFSFLERNKIDVKTHGFAVWSPSIILNYPWTSCDAATWRLLAAYGGIFYPVGGYANPDFKQNPLCMAVSENRVSPDLLPFSKQLIEMISEDGYDFKKLQESWEGRSEINIRYFIEFEKWCNAQKAKINYQPRSSLF